MQRSARTKSKLAGSLLGVGAIGALTAGPALATALSAFHTQGWAVQCYVVGEEAPPTLICSLPRTGFFVSMRAAGRALTGANPLDKNHHDFFAARRLLGYGRYWEFRPLFGCVSRLAGLECWNAAGHGWSLGRSGKYRLF